MLNMMTKLKASREEGSSMFFALAVMLIAITVTMLIAGYTLTNLVTTKKINSLSTFEIAADTAVNNAILAANSATVGGTTGTDILEAHRGVNNAAFGTVAASSSTLGVKWRWYTEQVATGGQRVYYYVYATGYLEDPEADNSRTVRVLLSSRVVSGAVVDSITGEIQYKASDQAVHQWGFMGVNGAIFYTGAKLNSYDSYQILSPSTSSDVAAVGTNVNLTLPAGTGLDVFNQFGEDETATRCNGTGCTAVDTVIQPYTFGLSSLTDKVAEKCPLAASSYPNWVSSANSGLLTVSPTARCFNTMVFDTDTSVPAASNPANPVIAYVKGNITVNAGVEVNTGEAPTALQLYSQSGNSALFTHGSTANPTVFKGLVAGASLACADTSPHAGSDVSNLFVYGGLACNTLAFGTGSELWQDEGAANIKIDTDRTIWSVSKYENMN
jgi:hypothetical protein